MRKAKSIFLTMLFTVLLFAVSASAITPSLSERNVTVNLGKTKTIRQFITEIAAGKPPHSCVRMKAAPDLFKSLSGGGSI